MNNISLIILASGFSRRFVSNKLLYEFHGKKLIEYTFDKASAFLDVIVVTQYMEIKEMAESLGYHVVMNDHPEYGQGHSIALGVGACQNNACILMVADIQTADMLMLPVPKANFHTEVIKPSPMQEDMIKSLADRAEEIRKINCRFFHFN